MTDKYMLWKQILNVLHTHTYHHYIFLLYFEEVTVESQSTCAFTQNADTLSLSLYIYLSSHYFSRTLSICLSVCMSISLDVCVAVCLCLCLCVRLSVYLPLSIYLCVCPLIYLLPAINDNHSLKSNSEILQYFSNQIVTISLIKNKIINK